MFIDMFNGAIRENGVNDTGDITTITADIGLDNNNDIEKNINNDGKQIIIDTHHHIDGETPHSTALNKNIEKAYNLDLLSADSQFDIYFENNTECYLSFDGDNPVLNFGKIFIKDIGYFDFTNRKIYNLYNEYNLPTEAGSNNDNVAKYNPSPTFFTEIHINDNIPRERYTQSSNEDMFFVVLNLSYYKVGGYEANGNIKVDNLTNNYGVVSQGNQSVVIGQKNVLEYSFSIINVDNYRSSFTDININGKTRNYCPFIDLSRASYGQGGDYKTFKSFYYQNNTSNIKSKKIIIGSLNPIHKKLYEGKKKIIFFKNDISATYSKPYPTLDEIQKPINNEEYNNFESLFLLNKIRFLGNSFNTGLDFDGYNIDRIQEYNNTDGSKNAMFNGDFYFKRKSGFFIHCLNSNLVSDGTLTSFNEQLFYLCYNSSDEKHTVFLTSGGITLFARNDIKIQVAFDGAGKYLVSGLESFLKNYNKFNISVFNNIVNNNIYIYPIEPDLENIEIKSNDFLKYNIFGFIKATKVYFKNVNFTKYSVNFGIKDCIFDNCKGVENIIPNYTANIIDKDSGNIVIDYKNERYGQINSLLNRVQALEDRHKQEIGQIAYFPTIIAPPNYLKLDGSSYPQSDYPLLFNYFKDKASDVGKASEFKGIGKNKNENRYIEETQARNTKWPSGNLRETFISYNLIVNGEEVPYFKILNFQGMFFRVLDEGGGVHPDSENNSILKYEEDTIKEHKHDIKVNRLVHLRTSQGSGSETELSITEEPPYSTENYGSRETRPKSVQLCAYIKYQ